MKREFNTLAYLPLLLLAVAVPLALDMVEPNGLYGFRTAASQASDANWYSANRATGRALAILSVVALVLNLTVGRRLQQPLARTMFFVATILVCALGSTVAGFMALP